MKPKASLHGAGRASLEGGARSADHGALTGANTEDIAERAQSTAAYIAQMTAELAKLARSRRFEMLTYLLDIARLEAENRSGRSKGLRAPAG